MLQVQKGLQTGEGDIKCDHVLTLPLKQPLFPSSHFFSLRQHISVSEVKVDKMQVNGRDPGTTFAVCLDQDEKKFIQSVTR